MPLLTDSLDQARRAYEVLEGRALSAEVRAEKLQAENAKLLTRPEPTVDPALLRQRILDLEGENFELRAQVERLASLKSDLLLQHFIDSVGLAAAIGEASMPGRAIASIKADIRTYLGPSGSGIGLRFQQPELGAIGAGLSSTSFEIVKTPPPSGIAAPSNLYVVLQELQRVYTDPFLLRFEPASQIVVEIAKALSNSGAWTALYLVEVAGNLAALQEQAVAVIAAVAPGSQTEVYGSAVNALRRLTDAQRMKTNLVAGDLYALTSALESTMTAAMSLINK